MTKLDVPGTCVVT